MHVSALAGIAPLFALLAACASGPPTASAQVAARFPRGASINELSATRCIGQKATSVHAPPENRVTLRDGTCLCYAPPWRGGVPDPEEREKQARSDFDGVFLCRPAGAQPPATPGGDAEPGAEDRLCPKRMPIATAHCSVEAARLRNGDCLYLAEDLENPTYFRCDRGVWGRRNPREVDDEAAKIP
jgi:hypothetical protein